jgi:hypothetical protein
MSGPFGSSQWMYASGGFYNGVATQSLRFDPASNPSLTKTPSSASNRKTWTLSFWTKRCGLGGDKIVFNAGVTGTDEIDIFFPSDNFMVSDRSGKQIKTNAVYRDVSSWYHFVIVMDTTEATDTNRLKLYVNGVQETSFNSPVYPTLNQEFSVNNTKVHYVGTRSLGDNDYDGYLAEMNLIDGTALDASYFGEFKNGVWIAKRYTGSYGTNGFRLQFNQTGTGTASSSTIGADTSGNANHFTSSGIVASDCDMPDSPENNFATFNGVDTRFRSELAEGNLNLRATTYSSGNWGHSICTFKIPSSGKWYIEAYGLNITGNNTSSIGIMDRNVVSTSATQVNYSITTDEGFDGIRQGHYSSPFMRIIVDGTTSGSDISFTNQSAISALAIDVDNGYIYVGGNDGTGGTGSEITWRDYADGSTGSSNVDPTSGSSGTGGIARTFTNNDIILCDVSVSGDNSSKSQVYLNAGQDSSFAGNLTAQGNSDANGVGDFYYQVPDGYLALCTSNLPEPTISPNADTQSDDYFNTVLYTGTGSSGQAITGVNFQPDWLWIKKRSGASSHNVFDSVRGVAKRLITNGTSAEDEPNQITSFDTDGFTINSGNDSGATYVSWNWKAGGTAVSNTDGSITSSVSTNTDAGFSIVSYTGTGGTATVGHGLGAIPKLIISKTRNVVNSWTVYAEPVGNDKRLILNSTNAAGTDAAWGNTTPTSSVITLGSADTNGSGNTYIAYCFASVEGYSKFGSYTGNGSTDGTFVYTGFRPAFIIFKNTSSGSTNWIIKDTVRDTSNQMDIGLEANTSDAEESSLASVDFLSNGMKIRSTGSFSNTSGDSYIYMAFAEVPFKYSTGR